MLLMQRNQCNSQIAALLTKINLYKKHITQSKGGMTPILFMLLLIEYIKHMGARKYGRFNN